MPSTYVDSEGHRVFTCGPTFLASDIYYTHTYTYICNDTHLYIYTYIYIDRFICVNIIIIICLYIYMVCIMYVCMYVRTYVG